MKTVRIIIVIFLLLALGNMASGQMNVFNGTSSAGVTDDTVLFNCDVFDPIGIPDYNVYLNYKGENDNEYSATEMALMMELPYYAMTHESSVTFSQSPGILNYYFSAGIDSFLATQSPENTGNLFPPPFNLYAPFVDDPQGDAVEPLGDWLDLIKTGMCFSDSRVYGYLENVTGTWPDNESINFFIYALGFVPSDMQDTTVWAMVYGNIPFAISPGLYKLSLADSSYTRLGDIDYQVGDDQRMHMACDISEFENDPSWPGWPDDGFLISMGITFTFGFTSQTLNDYTFPTVYEPRTQYLDFGSNTSPIVTDYSFDIIPGVSVTSMANYVDDDNNLPTVRLLFFDWGFYEMGSYDHTYDDTATFERVLDWPGDAWHYYHFQFSDGAATYETATDSIYLSSSGIDDDQILPSDITLDQNYPNPFNGSTNISFALDRAAFVTLTVYDVLGRQVHTIYEGMLPAGSHTLNWTAGEWMPSGIYFYRLKTDKNTFTRQMVYIK